MSGRVGVSRARGRRRCLREIDENFVRNFVGPLGCEKKTNNNERNELTSTKCPLTCVLR